MQKKKKPTKVVRPPLPDRYYVVHQSSKVDKFRLPPQTKRLTTADIHKWLNRKGYLVATPTVAPVEFELEVVDDPSVEVRTLLWVKTDFYKRHTTHTHHPQIKRPILHGQDPHVLLFNPPATDDGSDALHPSAWYAMYRFGYWVKVIQNLRAPIHGPHIAKLFLEIAPRSGTLPPQHEWLGTAQFECIFASEVKMRVSLRRAIRLREYYASEDFEDCEIRYAREIRRPDAFQV